MASTTTQPDYPGMLPPPPGVTPNITDPESIGWKLVVAGVVCPVIALVFWTLRVYTARRILRKFHLDDWLITASLILAIGLSIVDISQTKYGMGVHMWEVTPSDFQHSIIVGLPASIFYNLSTLCVKASILFFYLRFAAANQAFRVTVYALLFVVAGYSLNAAFSFLYLCTPIHKLWDLATPGSCVDLYSAFLASAAINAATDVAILLLPSWLLWPLRLHWRHKVAVSLVMMTGGFVCAVSFFRLASIPLGKDNMDTTWQYCINNIWCLVELYVGIVCACLPCLKPFVKEHFPSIFSASPDSDGNNSPESSGGFSSSLFARRRRRRQVVSDHASPYSQDNSYPPSSSNSGGAGSAREKKPVPVAAEVEIPTP
ncbi:hypothetical protein B0T24DRAFT_130275 [Lasiosphaeria ovina]|uniref:Rhodopsin domain-containing protein n=1 Tax=Lasiosphaeria ovina TaxID=92902 RepID=A0AAE0JS61_9PEZI|nr:hypothetical protein B0T24DRAFT_130275 [Lasiosphaeria ovina]